VKLSAVAESVDEPYIVDDKNFMSILVHYSVPLPLASICYHARGKDETRAPGGLKRLVE
jgi:hypothetical protein